MTSTNGNELNEMVKDFTATYNGTNSSMFVANDGSYNQNKISYDLTV